MQVILVVTACSDRYMLSLFPPLYTPVPPFSPSLISLMVSVDVKHHVYLLTCLTKLIWQSVEEGAGKRCSECATYPVITRTSRQRLGELLHL